MKRILIPTDFSEEAEYAVKLAAEIAKKKDATLYLLNIVDIPSHESWNNQTAQDVAYGAAVLKMVKRKFAKFFEKPFMKDVKALEVVQINLGYDQFFEQVEKHEIDLIVMGSHGATGWREMFEGSNAEKVVRTVNCPVLTLKNERAAADIKNILFASNFYGEITPAFSHIKTIAELFDAKIHFLKVITENSFESTSYSMNTMKTFAKDAGVDWEVTMQTVNAENIEDGVKYFANEYKMDMVAMPTHGRSGIMHFLFGSVTEDIVNHLNIPVLSIRLEKEE